MFEFIQMDFFVQSVALGMLSDKPQISSSKCTGTCTVWHVVTRNI